MSSMFKPMIPQHNFLGCLFIFFLFLPGIFLFSGCCSSEPSAVLEKTQNRGFILAQEEDLQSSPPEEGKLNSKEKEESFSDTEYVSESFSQRYMDFQRRIETQNPQDLVFFAENLFDRAPAQAVKEKMEISFFLSQAYLQRNEKDKARLWSDKFLEIRRAMSGAGAFREHKKNMEAPMELSKKGWIGVDE